eukprot:12100825-Prorocentrum_lima.AAC.1
MDQTFQVSPSPGLLTPPREGRGPPAAAPGKKGESNPHQPAGPPCKRLLRLQQWRLSEREHCRQREL